MKTETKTKLNFGRLKKAAPKTETIYPVYDNEEASVLAAGLVKQKPIVQSFDSGKKQLCDGTRRFYFEHHSQMREVASSIAIPAGEKEVLISFRNQYRVMDEDGVLAMADINARIPDLFQETFEIKIDGSKIPLDKAQDVIDGLVEVFSKYECEDAIGYKQRHKPIESFHASRHQMFDVDTNMEIDGICPVTTAFKIR